MLVLCYHLYLLFGDILISQLYTTIMMLNIRSSYARTQSREINIDEIINVFAKSSRRLDFIL